MWCILHSLHERRERCLEWPNVAGFGMVCEVVGAGAGASGRDMWKAAAPAF
jgi:hypothetical protein